MAPEEYTVGFYDEAAYAEFAEVDCDDFRELIEIIRKDPFPDKSGLKWEIPGTVNEFFAFKQTDDLIFKLTYFVEFNPRRVAISASHVKRMPPMPL